MKLMRSVRAVGAQQERMKRAKQKGLASSIANEKELLWRPKDAQKNAYCVVAEARELGTTLRGVRGDRNTPSPDNAARQSPENGLRDGCR